MSTALKHLSEPAPKICINRPDLPLELDDILARAMAKDRELRYRNASELVSDLRLLPEAPSARSRSVPGWREGSDPDAATQPEMAEQDRGTVPDESLSTAEFPAEVMSGNASTGAAALEKTPAAAPEPGLTPPQPFSERQPDGSSRRTGILALGLSGVTVVGLCSLLLLAGLFYQFVLKPEAGNTPPLASQSAGSSTEQPGSAPLFADDFSQPAHGWPAFADEGASYSYQDGAYRMVVRATDVLFWATPDGSYTDASISVSATLLSGSQESYYGLLCRLQDEQEFYYMVIRVDGRYTIGKYRDGEFLSLLPGGWSASQAIRPGADQNQLRADCVGGEIRFFVNGDLLAQVQDETLVAGKPGLAAAAIGSGPLDVSFDNFLVTDP